MLDFDELQDFPNIFSWATKSDYICGLMGTQHNQKTLYSLRFPDYHPGNCTIAIRWRDMPIDQIISKMVAILNFKINTVEQFINRPICFLDLTDVGAAAKIYFYIIASLRSYRAKYILYGGHIGFQDGRHKN